MAKYRGVEGEINRLRRAIDKAKSSGPAVPTPEQLNGKPAAELVRLYQEAVRRTQGGDGQ